MTNREKEVIMLVEVNVYILLLTGVICWLA